MILSTLKPGGPTGREIAPPAPAFYGRRKKRGHEIGQLLIQAGRVRPELLREALSIQEEQGGLIGAILVRIGACGQRAVAEALIDQVRLRSESDRPEELAARAREEPSIVGLRVPCAPRLTVAVLFIADALLMLAGAALGRALSERSWQAVLAHQYDTLSVVALGTVAFTMFRLHSVTPPSPPDEIRRCVSALFIVYIGATAVVQMHATDFFGYGRGAYAFGWGISVFLVPLGRAALRHRLAAKNWWGRAVVVFGAGRFGRSLVRTLRARPQLGLKPVAILDDDKTTHGTLRATWSDEDIAVESVRSIPSVMLTPVPPPPDSLIPMSAPISSPISSAPLSPPLNLDRPSVKAVWGRFSEVEGVPVVGTLDLAPVLAQRLNIRSAVVAMPHLESDEVSRLIERVGGTFDNILVIPDLFNLAFLGTPMHNLGGVLGVELRQQLLLRGPRVIKRTMDLILTVVGGIVILPLLFLLALAVKIDSSGPVLYHQKRLGRHGARFPSFKFRTMHGDGEKRLQEVLDRDPRLKAEYDTFHKLSSDPRITRVGRFLRKYSLDELPQIWNVLRGDMSLVGPRPYLEREIPDMEQQEWIILRVRPGITGIWQVTERNTSAFRERLKLDVEYVRNWSPWLDIYVLARTVGVVLAGTGS